MDTKRVLIPIDGSDFSLQVLPHLQQFLDPTQTELVLFHVAPEPGVLELEPGNPEMTVYVDQQEAGLAAEFSDAMLPYTDMLTNAGFQVSTATRFGPPAGEIEHYIAEEGIDLVAMTTHGRTGLARLVLGSVAEHVLHHARVPVLLFRPVDKLTINGDRPLARSVASP
jgi:nucleotide-binding universal stress UspA family protein